LHPKIPTCGVLWERLDCAKWVLAQLAFPNHHLRWFWRAVTHSVNSLTGPNKSNASTTESNYIITTILEIEINNNVIYISSKLSPFLVINLLSFPLNLLLQNSTTAQQTQLSTQQNKSHLQAIVVQLLKR
jgi:hypothetical protein